MVLFNSFPRVEQHHGSILCKTLFVDESKYPTRGKRDDNVVREIDALLRHVETFEYRERGGKLEAMTLTPKEQANLPAHYSLGVMGEEFGGLVTSRPALTPTDFPSINEKFLERIALRLGMCFRVFPEDVAVIKTAFPQDVTDCLFFNGIDACFSALQARGFLSEVKGEYGSRCFAVPADVSIRLERAQREKIGLSHEEFSLVRKKEHAVLAEAFLASQVSVMRRRRYQAEALVQFRKAEEWEKLEAMFQSVSIHLFGTHDSYIGRAYIDIPHQVVQKYPAFILAMAMAEASAGVTADHNSLDNAFSHLLAAPFKEVESRLDNLVAVYGPQWPTRPTIDGKLFFGINLMRHHRQRGDIVAARDTADRLITEVPQHIQKGDLPTESNLHWLENERGILEFMDTNWQAAYLHQMKTIDMTFSKAVPGQYVPRFACTVSALQQALCGNTEEAVKLFNMAASLLDEHGDQEYIEFTLDLVQLILCLDELDFKNGERFARKLDERIFRFEIWGIAIQAVQLFDLLLDRHSANQARLDLTRTSGPGVRQLSRLNKSLVRQSEIDVLQAFGQIQRSRDLLLRHSKKSAGENVGYARLHFLGGRYDRALLLSQSILSGEDVMPRERGMASALIVATYVRLNDEQLALRELGHCLEISANAATLLPIALLPKGVREKVIKLAQADKRWSALAESVGLSVSEMERRLSRVGQCFPEEALLVDLTPRENVVLEMLDNECAQIEIARREHVTLSTIKKQIASIYRKLRVSNRNDALEVAYRLGLLG